jgi:hypothetical protein
MLEESQTDTGLWEGSVKYAVEVGSGAITYMPIFIKIGSGIQTFITEDTQTHRQYGKLRAHFFFFKNKESRLKIGLKTLIF